MKSILCLLVFMTIWQVNAIKHGTAQVMKFESLDKRSRGTWYTGDGLRNAACYGRNGLKSFSASITDMIGAMAMNSFEQCYKCMEITNKKHPKNKIVVKIIDKCAACQVGKAIDLTPKAFKLLSKGDLDVGVLDISFKPIRCSKRKGLFPNLPLL